MTTEVIGTDGHRVGLNSQGTVSTLTVNGRVRGLFESTTVGYLELASVTGADAELLRGATTMVSAGEPFASWQAWVPPLHTVSVTPAGGLGRAHLRLGRVPDRATGAELRPGEACPR